MAEQESIEELKKKIAVLEQRLAFFENDPSKRGYFALVRIVNQQIDYLNEFVIKKNVGGKASEDATFARTKDMWENLPKMISSLSDLKIQLQIVDTDDKGKRSGYSRTTPEAIAEELGDYKKTDV